MYFFIFEDGSYAKGKDLPEEAEAAVEDGYLVVIDMGDCDPKDYVKGKWIEVEEVMYE